MSLNKEGSSYLILIIILTPAIINIINSYYSTNLTLNKAQDIE